MSEQFSPDRHEDGPKPASDAGSSRVSAHVISAPKAIATPCVMVCAVDGESGLCLGCFRTLKEIAGWRALSDDERAAVMADLPGRRDRIDPAKLA